MKVLLFGPRPGLGRRAVRVGGDRTALPSISAVDAVAAPGASRMRGRAPKAVIVRAHPVDAHRRQRRSRRTKPDDLVPA